MEAASGYQLIHGYAVAIGMRAVAELAVRCGYADKEVAAKLEELLRQYRLPTEIPSGLDRDVLRRYLQADKKTIGGRVFFVLPEAIGKVRITDQVQDADLDAVLAGGTSEG